MKNRWLAPVWALLFFGFAVTAFAQNPDTSPARPQSIVFAGGGDLNDDDLDIYEFLYTRNIPSWDWSIGETTRLSTRLWLSLGVLDQAAGDSLYGTAGPIFYIHRNGHAYFNFGIRLTVLSDDVIGTLDFGGPVQFTSLIGVGYWFDNGWEIGLRVQHISNARLYEPNPDINFVVLQAGYGF